MYFEVEDTTGVIRTREIKEGQTTQWPKEKGETTIYNRLHRNNWNKSQEPY